jgi:hypothetical protein
MSFGQNQFQLKHIREIKNGPGQIFKISKLYNQNYFTRDK